MEETIGWLLPLLLAASLANAICSAADQRVFRRSFPIAMGVLLAGMSGWLVLHPAIHWEGPVLFELDRVHHLDVSLRLTLVQLPLVWLVWWWMADEPPETSSRVQHEGGLCQAVLPCLLLMLVSDNLWLWYGALAAFSLLQHSLINRDTAPDFRGTALRGAYWLGILLLLISVGILSFDFRWQTFSNVFAVPEAWDGFSQSQRAGLTLAATLAAWSVLLTAAVFPISVLRIDRDDEGGFDILSAVVAGAVCVQFAPLISVLDVAAAHRSLLLLTVLTAIVCSWQQPSSRRATRCLGTGFIMLSLLGLLIGGVSSLSQVARALSLEHLAVALILWKLWDRDRHDRNSMIVAGCLAVLLVGGFSSCLLTLSTTAPAGPIPGRLNLILAAGLSFGLAAFISRIFYQTLEETRERKRPSLSGLRLKPVCFVFFAVIVTTRVMLGKAGNPLLVLPALEVLAAMLAGAVAAILWERRKSQSPEAFRSPGSFSRLLESQFHLVSVWQGMMQFPGIVLSTANQLWNVWRLRSPTGPFRKRGSAEESLPFVWELGLGLASLIVLSCLFLWMGG